MNAFSDPIVPSTFVARLLSYAHKRGVHASELIQTFHLPPTTEQQPFITLPISKIIALADAIAEMLQDPFVGVHSAEAAERGDLLSVLAFACSASATLGEALEKYLQQVSIIRHMMIISSHSTAHGLVVRQIVPSVPGCLGRQGNEHWVASVLVAAERMVAKDWKPARVWLAHPKPKTTEELVRVYRTSNIVFDAEMNAVEVGRSTLNLPIHGRKDDESTVLKRYITGSPPPLVDQSTFQLQVRAVIAERLPHGPPLIQDIAKSMRMSARTLQRRMTEEGLTFQTVLDDVRRDVALRHVERGDIPLAAVAQKVGYSQQSAFFRSFRRWTGTTPSRARSASKSDADRINSE